MKWLDAAVAAFGSDEVQDKVTIASAFQPALPAAGSVRLGDDCAAIPMGDEYLLVASEGMLPAFVERDPWFAGYSAVMVNVNDVSAMGGRAVAVTDVIWTPSQEDARPVWDGMVAAARSYGVPIVGGHTTRQSRIERVVLAASVVGYARSLLTSFDARPGDHLVMAVDLAGRFRDPDPFWDASTSADAEHLRRLTGLLPTLAERGLSSAAKDISNGGVLGTLVMLLNASEVGIELDFDTLPHPPGCDPRRWLAAFPSFGMLIAVADRDLVTVVSFLEEASLTARSIGRLTRSRRVTALEGGERRTLWDGSVPGSDHPGAPRSHADMPGTSSPVAAPADAPSPSTTTRSV